MPGWYWERRASGVRIIELPHCGVWPRHWRERKNESMRVADEETRVRLAQMPDSQWLVEYAGPIEEPCN